MRQDERMVEPGAVFGSQQEDICAQIPLK